MSFIINKTIDYKKISEQIMNDYYFLYDRNFHELEKVYTSDSKITFDNHEFIGFSNFYYFLRNLGYHTFYHSNVLCTPQIVGNGLLISCSGFLTLNCNYSYKFYQALLLTNVNGLWIIVNDILTIF